MTSYIERTMSVMLAILTVSTLIILTGCTTVPYQTVNDGDIISLHSNTQQKYVEKVSNSIIQHSESHFSQHTNSVHCYFAVAGNKWFLGDVTEVLNIKLEQKDWRLSQKGLHVGWGYINGSQYVDTIRGCIIRVPTNKPTKGKR